MYTSWQERHSPDLNEEDAIYDIKHVKDRAHRGRLYLYWGETSSWFPRVDLIHLLLEDYCLMSEMAETLGRLLCFLVILSQLEHQAIYITL